MILDDYTSGVIAVHATPRSGSTLFCNWLKRKLDIPNAGEMFHMENAESQETAKKAIAHANKENTDFIFKYFPSAHTFDSTKFYNRTKFYNVNLKRNNIAKQITSLYIANKTGRWQTHDRGIYARKFPVKLEQPVLDIDEKIIKATIKDFIRQLTLKEDYDKTVKYNAVYIYEDIIDYLNENKPQGLPLVPSTKPENYTRIYACVIGLLRKYIRANNNIPQIALDWNDNFAKHGYRL